MSLKNIKGDKFKYEAIAILAQSIRQIEALRQALPKRKPWAVNADYMLIEGLADLADAKNVILSSISPVPAVNTPTPAGPRKPRIERLPKGKGKPTSKPGRLV